MTLSRRLAAEAVGTASLSAAVIGSGIMAARLAGGSDGLALLANALATGAALVALLATFGPVSGAHFNPVVSAAEALLGRLRALDGAAYAVAQIGGAVAGAMAAHAMFELPIVSLAKQARGGTGQMVAECIATAGLVAVIRGSSLGRAALTPFAVASYIVAAYWFTSSTSFANPALTIARALTDTFAGIRPADVPAFVAAQLAGAAFGTAFFRWIEAGMHEARRPAEARDRPELRGHGGEGFRPLSRSSEASRGSSAAGVCLRS